MQTDLELRIDAFLARELGTAAEEKARADEWKKRALAAEAALAERDKPCMWKDDGEYWETNCGESFVFYDGTPVENKCKFCPYCGHRIEVAILSPAVYP